MKRNVSRKGFTLIELLVSISVLAILIAIMAPAITGLRTSARKAEVSSNMRSIGMGLQTYITEHNNQLPQSFELQRSTVSGLNMQFFAKLLRPYLGVPNLPQNAVNPLFGDAVWAKAIGAGSKSDLEKFLMDVPSSKRSEYSRFVLHLYTTPDGREYFPFGKYGTSLVGYTMPQIDSPANTWSLMEADNYMRPTIGRKLALKEPLFGSTRTTLYFDMSVRPTDVADFPVLAGSP